MHGVLGDSSPAQSPFTSDALVAWSLSEIGDQQSDGRSTWQDLAFFSPQDAGMCDVGSPVIGLHIYMEVPNGGFVQVKTGGFDPRSLLRFSSPSARQGTLRFFRHARWTHPGVWPLDCAGIPERSDGCRVIVISVYADGSRVRHVIPRP